MENLFKLLNLIMESEELEVADNKKEGAKLCNEAHEDCEGCCVIEARIVKLLREISDIKSEYSKELDELRKTYKGLLQSRIAEVSQILGEM